MSLNIALKDKLATLHHKVLMATSKKYACDFFLEELRKEVSKCAHSPAPLSLLRQLVADARKADHTRDSEAVTILAEGNNFDVMELSMEYDHRRAKECADKVMQTARRHLELCGHIDRAEWAHHRFLVARRWYRKANALTSELDAEIREGFRKVSWLIPLRFSED